MFAKIVKNKPILISSIAALVGILAYIFFLIESGNGENGVQANGVYGVLLIPILLEVLSIYIYIKLPEKSYLLSIIGIVQTALYALSLGLFIVGRISWLFAMLSKMSAAPLTAMFPVTIATMLIALIINIVSTFFAYPTSEASLETSPSK